MTFKYDNVYLKETATVCGPYEKKGPLRKYFDKTYDDLYFGEKSWGVPLDFLTQNSYYLSVGSNSLSFGFGLRQARSLLRSQNIFSVTKEEFK